jgi:hypothetical protein
MKIILSLIIGGALVVSGFGQTRNVLVGTNNAVTQPTNFWSADAVNARVGLGLGTAATNPASAFQPSSLALSNLASNNGGNLTNINLTNVVGVLDLAQGGTGSTNASAARIALELGTAATNPATAFQPSSTTLSNLAISNGGNLTNLQASNLVGLIPSSNISSITLTNISGTLPIAQGGTGATNAVNARQNLGSTTVGDALFISLDALTARTAIGALATNGNATNLTNFPANLLRNNGSAAALTNFPLSLLTTNGNGAALTNITAANITGTVALASNLSSPLSLTNGGTGATNAATARTNLGATTIGDSLFTATNAQDAFDALGIGTNLSTSIIGVSNIVVSSFTAGSGQGFLVPSVGQTLIVRGTNVTNSVPAFFGWDGFLATAFSAAESRTNIGLTLPALTNTNNANFLAAFFGADTNPVLVNTNGQVVSPTNFWQVAPITTTFIESQPTTNQTTNIAAGRNLHIHSIAFSTVGITNTIALPTTNSFNGDIALVVHQGPTSSVTAVRTAGAATNLITLNRFDQAVEFVYYNSVWQFNHNLSFIEPIYFSGTNASANAAASVTNLFTPNAPLVYNTNGEVVANTGTNELRFTNAVAFSGNPDFLTINGTTISASSSLGELIFEEQRFAINNDSVWDWANNDFRLFVPLVFENTQDAATTRTNLGLGTTNDVQFNNVLAESLREESDQSYITLDDAVLRLYGDTSVSVDSAFVATSSAEFATNVLINGFVNFSTNHTNVAPATNNQIQNFLQIRIGTNAFFLPLYK